MRTIISLQNIKEKFPKRINFLSDHVGNFTEEQEKEIYQLKQDGWIVRDEHETEALDKVK